jgi:DNA polymerase-3 subunit epsilon
MTRRARAPKAVINDPSAGDRLVALSYAVVDVETTGGSPMTGHRVTEIAAVIVRDGRVSETFETLVNPERSIPPFITRLTHITPSMVRDKPTFREIAPRVADLLRGHVFVGHNAAFDRRFVRAEAERAGCDVPVDRVLCTVRMARRLVPHLRRRSLDYLADHFGVPIGDRHRAMGDAMATAHCFIRLLDEAGVHGFDTWADMAGLVGRARRAARRRPTALPRPAEWDWGA